MKVVEEIIKIKKLQLEVGDVIKYLNTKGKNKPTYMVSKVEGNGMKYTIKSLSDGIVYEGYYRNTFIDEETGKLDHNWKYVKHINV